MMSRSTTLIVNHIVNWHNSPPEFLAFLYVRSIMTISKTKMIAAKVNRFKSTGPMYRMSAIIFAKIDQV